MPAGYRSKSKRSFPGLNTQFEVTSNSDQYLGRALIELRAVYRANLRQNGLFDPEKRLLLNKPVCGSDLTIRKRTLIPVDLRPKIGLHQLRHSPSSREFTAPGPPKDRVQIILQAGIKKDRSTPFVAAQYVRDDVVGRRP